MPRRKRDTGSAWGGQSSFSPTGYGDRAPRKRRRRRKEQTFGVGRKQRKRSSSIW